MTTAELQDKKAEILFMMRECDATMERLARKRDELAAYYQQLAERVADANKLPRTQRIRMNLAA